MSNDPEFVDPVLHAIEKQYDEGFAEVRNARRAFIRHVQSLNSTRDDLWNGYDDMRRAALRMADHTRDLAVDNDQ